MLCYQLRILLGLNHHGAMIRYFFVLLCAAVLNIGTLCAQQTRIYNGIDVSHHNDVCWDSVLADANVTFCYIKATEGTHFLDPMASQHYQQAKAGGLHTGFYHYLRFDVPGRKQYERFKQVLDSHPGYDLMPVVDVERGFNDFADTAQLNATLRQFVRAFEDDFGYHPIIYYCDYTPMDKVVSHAEHYCKWVPRWRLGAVDSHIDIYQNFVGRIANVPVDFDYCPNLDHILTPDHLPCWRTDVLHHRSSCHHGDDTPPMKIKHKD